MKYNRYLLLLIIGVLILGGSVWGWSRIQRGSSEQSSNAAISGDNSSVQTTVTSPDGEVMTAPAPEESALADEVRPDTNTTYTLADVAKHATASDCWLVIEGGVYDVTAFIARHPGGQAIVAGCGKDATVGFNSRPQGSGTPHSEAARRMLAEYQIGRLSAE